MRLYNTLKRKKETFKPIGKIVKMYSCGPTVYWYQHIGNFRTMLLNDFLKRSLQYEGYKVEHVMNSTDVDDKTIKASAKEGISLKELTRKYEQIFLDDLDALGIIRPTLVRATEHIDSMIKMIQKLMKKGYAYKTSDGVYFSVEKSKNYGKLAQLNSEDSQTRVEGHDKEHSKDFALWKFHTQEDGKVFWEAPFGKGRPGWHIECSAMSTEYLGDSFDIHTGAIDLIFPHHTNEIAQSEGATGKQFVRYWVHGEFLNMGEKMSKSLGNIITLSELIEKGYSPMHYRYLCLLTHYRKGLNFTFESLDAARNAYERLFRLVRDLKDKSKGKDLSKKYRNLFKKAIEDDLNLPQAIQVLWTAINDEDFDSEKKRSLILEFDKVLGLELDSKEIKIPREIKELVKKREEFRSKKMWSDADKLRKEIEHRGFIIEDNSEETKISKK